MHDAQRRPTAALSAAALIVAAMTALAGALGASAQDAGDASGGHTPVTICHWVPAHGGSFVVITVDDDGASGNANSQAHGGHDNDIIPAPSGACPDGATQPTQTAPTATSVTGAGTAVASPTSTRAPDDDEDDEDGGDADEDEDDADDVDGDEGTAIAATTADATTTPLSGGGVAGVTSGPSSLPSAGSGDGRVSPAQYASVAALFAALSSAGVGAMLLRRGR
jgi:hypothetical protein